MVTFKKTKNAIVPLEVKDDERQITYTIKKQIGTALMPEIPYNMREAVNIDDEEQIGYGLILLPPAFEGLANFMPMMETKPSDFDSHFLGIESHFEDKDSKFYCCVFPLGNTRLGRVRFSNGWPEKFLKVVLKRLLICSAIGFDNFVPSMLDMDQIYMDIQDKIIKISVGLACYRPFSSTKTRLKFLGPPQVEKEDQDKSFTWCIALLGLNMAYGISCMDDVKNGEIFLDIASFLAKERKLCDSWYDLKHVLLPRSLESGITSSVVVSPNSLPLFLGSV